MAESVKRVRIVSRVTTKKSSARDGASQAPSFGRTEKKLKDGLSSPSNGRFNTVSPMSSNKKKIMDK